MELLLITQPDSVIKVCSIEHLITKIELVLHPNFELQVLWRIAIQDRSWSVEAAASVIGCAMRPVLILATGLGFAMRPGTVHKIIQYVTLGLLSSQCHWNIYHSTTAYFILSHPVYFTNPASWLPVIINIVTHAADIRYKNLRTNKQTNGKRYIPSMPTL